MIDLPSGGPSVKFGANTLKQREGPEQIQVDSGLRPKKLRENTVFNEHPVLKWSLCVNIYSLPLHTLSNVYI